MSHREQLVLNVDLAESLGIDVRQGGASIATAMATVFALDVDIVRTVKRHTGALVAVRGDVVRIDADTPEKAARVRDTIERLFHDACLGKEVTFEGAWHMITETTRSPLHEAQPSLGSDATIPLKRGAIEAQTAGQATYLASLRANVITVAVGPAGTGKTYLGMCHGIQLLEERRVERLIVARPALEAGERIGFLPGAIEDKMDPWLMPVFDVLHAHLGRQRTDRLRAEGVIELAPLAFMRGRTLRRAFVLLDEAQNTTPAQMKMFLTRIGHGSVMVVTGDPDQSDLPMLSHRDASGNRRFVAPENGLSRAVSRLHDLESIGVVTFTTADVRRHPLIGGILTNWDRKEPPSNALPHPD